MEEFSAPESGMLLRERVKRLLGNDLHASWKSLPEVKSSGLLETLSESRIALEELKFCLITCEVVYNTELAELLNLSKRSVSWADPLPSFNRRTIASTIEKVKHCSDGFLSTFEEQWNMKPVVNLKALNKMFEDMASELQSYITYCSHQEDLCTVLHNAMRSKYEIVAASFSKRLNVERVMLPLQHLKLYRLLFQDIHSMFLDTTNRLDNFYCKRILTNITKLLEECYKVLGTLHGSTYLEKLGRTLEENVHCFEPKPAGKNTSQHQENILFCTSVICGKQSNDSVEDTDHKSSEKGPLPNVTVNGCPSVKQQCLNIQTVEINSRAMVKCGDKFNMSVRREEPIKVPLVSNSKRSISYAEGQPTKNSCKRNSYHTESKYSVSEPTGSIHSATVEGRRQCSCLYETASRSVRNAGSKKHRVLLENKVKISVDNNKTLHITSSINSNDKPPNTSVISTNSHHICIPNFSGNLTNSNPESSYVKDVIRRFSVHDNLKVKNCTIRNSCPQPSKMQIHSIPSLGLQHNNCEKLSEHCNADKQLDTTFVVNKPTSPVPQPSKALFIKDEAVSLKDDLLTNGLHRKSECCTHEANREVHCTLLNEEEKCSDNFSLVNSQLQKHRSPSSDISSSMTKDISSTEEAAAEKSCIIKQLPRHEQQIFISFYDLGCLGTLYKPHFPLQKENARVDEMYNHYEPMNESFRANYHKLEPVSLYESLDRKVNGGNRTECGKRRKTYSECNIRVDDCGNAYEECKPCDRNHMNGDNLNSRSLSTYNIPIYQTYNFGDVKDSNTKAEENIYTEPEEHIYEEINFPMQLQPRRNDKEISIPKLEISKPSGSSQRLRWVDINEVVRSGLLDHMDASQIALQETKYEMITSEATYYMSLSILETVFITMKQCSEKFLAVLLDGWQEDLALGYLCHAVSKFVSSDNFKVYVDCCANHIHIDKTLQLLKLTNYKFTNAVLMLEAHPACQRFSLQTFLTLPMQRVTRLPMLVEAIIRRLPSNHTERRVWSETLVQLQKIVKECNEAAGRAQILTMQPCNQHVQPNLKTHSLNMKQHSQEKKQKTVWKIFTLGKEKMT
ncbi:hypothetical protein B7P43_G02311 [Cryptotermes secundus]|uniref:DH domain-containing protein n=1 Tax=Cryptotermes secundus TaxID=105785 RepID=A0A2J7RCR7_9NEOP|nr:hypothetical protein B7P43_G02311 [Cryptotermes secundus]